MLFVVISEHLSRYTGTLLVVSSRHERLLIFAVALFSGRLREQAIVTQLGLKVGDLKSQVFDLSRLDVREGFGVLNTVARLAEIVVDEGHGI